MIQEISKTEQMVREWFAKKTNREVTEFDDYDLYCCRVVTAFAETHNLKFPEA